MSAISMRLLAACSQLQLMAPQTQFSAAHVQDSSERAIQPPQQPSLTTQGSSRAPPPLQTACRLPQARDRAHLQGPAGLFERC